MLISSCFQKYFKFQDKTKPKHLCNQTKKKTIKKTATSVNKPFSNQKSTLLKVINKMNELESKSTERNKDHKTECTNIIFSETIDEIDKPKNRKSEFENIETPNEYKNMDHYEINSTSENDELYSCSPLASPAMTVINNKDLIVDNIKTTEKNNTSTKSSLLPVQNLLFNEQNIYFEPLADEVENSHNSPLLTTIDDGKGTEDLFSAENDFQLSELIDEMTSPELLRHDEENRKNTQTPNPNILDIQKAFEFCDKRQKNNKYSSNICQNPPNSINRVSSQSVSPIHNDSNNEDLKKQDDTSPKIQNAKFGIKNDIDWESITKKNPSFVTMSQKYLSGSGSQPTQSNERISHGKQTSRNHKQKRKFGEATSTTDVDSVTRVHMFYLITEFIQIVKIVANK